MEKYKTEQYLGTFENPIIDSILTKDEALAQNPDFLCPKEILDKQIVLAVKYFSFDKKIHQGQIIVDERLKNDIEEIFAAMLKNNFPIAMAIPVADEKIKWNDVASMEKNNCSGFNYRKIMGTNRLSVHALGIAIDINPAQNPYIKALSQNNSHNLHSYLRHLCPKNSSKYLDTFQNFSNKSDANLNATCRSYFATKPKDGIAYPAGSKYDINQIGTIAEDGFLVKMMEERGWTWGGRWEEKDYQHFQKQLES